MKATTKTQHTLQNLAAVAARVAGQLWGHDLPADTRETLEALLRVLAEVQFPMANRELCAIACAAADLCHSGQLWAAVENIPDEAVGALQGLRGLVQPLGLLETFSGA